MGISCLIQRSTTFFVAAVLTSWLPPAAAGSATADPAPWSTGAVFEEQLAAPIDIFWADLPFRQAIESVSKARRVAILLDRRVDPSQKVDLTVSGLPLESALRATARRRHLDVARLGSVVYLGPSDACSRLAAASRTLSGELSRLDPTIQKKSRQPKTFVWSDLATPRQLLQQTGSEVGLAFEGIDKIPHDLWAAADLPPMSLADRLTLIGIQYDVAFKAVGPNSLAIVAAEELSATMGPSTEPTVASAKNSASRHVAKSPKSRNASTIDQVRIDRLSVQEKPLKPVLQQLAKRLKLDLRWEEAAIAAAGISLDQRVTLRIENASVDELLSGLLKGTGLTYQRKQSMVEIRPAHGSSSLNR